MTESANPYRISRLWAEFVDPAMERAYRLHMQPLLARHLRVALWVWGCLLLAFGLQDLQALGMSDEFLILAGCRALQAALVFALALLLPRYPGLAASGYAVTALEITGLVLFLLAMFLFVPNLLKLSLMSAAVGVTLILVSIWSKGLGADVIIGALILMSLPVVTGFFATQQLHTVQRRQFAMYSQARRANRELKKEVERRRLLEEELKRQATTDPLTGLFNRRQYEMLFRRERERCRRQGSAICVAMADLDRFKALNDEFGHDGGDEALRHVARLFTSKLREGDVVGRFGGEEFIILLPDTGVAEAERVVERLRQALEEEPLMVAGSPRSLTATFSLSLVLDSENDISETLRRVDAGLYRGKRSGRNQVVVV